MTPKVSVLVPTYNCGPFLDEALQSVIDQTFTDFELIIVDNCSTDNTEEVVSKFLSDKRVKYFKNNVNLGLVGNWNRVLEYATGEYIKYLCADDKFHKQVLEKMVAAADQNPSVSLVVADKQFFGSLDKTIKMPFEYLVDGKEVIYKTLNSYDFMGDPTVVMFRRSNLHVGGFKDKLWIVDWDMWIRHLLVGDAFFIPEVLIYIRKHPNQVTNAVVKKNYTHHFAEYEFFKSIQEENQYGLDLSRIDLDNIIKRKAKKCTKEIIFKNIPKLLKNDQTVPFRKAKKIAKAEKVLISSFFELLENSFLHLNPNYRKKSLLMKKQNLGLPH